MHKEKLSPHRGKLLTDAAPSLGQDKPSSHGESSRQNRKSASLRPPHTWKGHHFLAMRLGFASPASTHKGRRRTNADITPAWNRRALKSLPPASFETFPRTWGRHHPPQPARPRGRRYPRAWSRLRPQSRQSPRQACYLSAWSKLHENHPTQKPEARCSSAWTTSPHTGKPLSDIFEAPPGTASAHGEPFLRIFPAHPAAGAISSPEPPLRVPHQMQAAGTSPHTRGGR